MAKESGGGTIGSAGRFGARYGRVSRRRVADIESQTHSDHACPECEDKTVERQGTGIWECQSCGYRFAGGTYRPETPGGRSARRSIRTAIAEETEDADAEENTEPDLEV